MADTTLKFKRGQESKVNSLAKEDGSVIFGLGSSGAPSTLHFDSAIGSSVQRLGVAVASASSANTASTATKLRTARKINDASFDGTKDVDITELHPVVITDQSVDLNTLRLTGDFLGRKLYLCGTDGGSSAITNKPETGNEGFTLLVEQLRWYNGSTDYANKQTLEYRTSHKVYIRYSAGANWGSWVLQSDDGIASTANYAKNSGALGGSSLSQVLTSAGGGSAFVGLDTTTNNVVKLTRANGGTVQKTINNVANATSASIANTARLASTAIYSSYNLPYQVDSQFYVTNDTHVMKYGYLKCDGSYQNITLLVTSAFWGNQHGSAYLINFQQDTNNDSSGSIHFTAQAIKIGGNATREYYAYADQTNKRLYLYGKVTGGNSYGKWNVSVLQSSGGYDDWVSDFAYNQNLPSGYSTISQIYPGTAQNSNALGGSSLSQVLNASGSGNAFTGLSGSGSSTLRFTRANGGTVNFTVNNVSHATSASIATTANIAKALPATVTLGNGNGAMIDQNGANYRQRIRIEDNGSANDNVFVFQQSANAGSTYTDLFRILDNGTVVANTFTGALNGTANYAKNSGQLQGHTLTTVSTGTSATFANHIPYISGSALEISRYIDFHGDGTSRDYSVRLDTGTPSKLIVSGPSASTVQAGYFQGVAQNSNALGGSSLSQVLSYASSRVSSSSYLNNYFTSRQTSANVAINGKGGLRTFKATSTMTTGKPTIGDSHILHFDWDNTGGYDSQIAVAAKNPHIQIRSQDTGTWSAWTDILDQNNYTKYIPLRTKTINAGFSTAFRTQTQGSTAQGSFLSMIRNNTASVANSPQFGSGIAWGHSDTHGYLYVSYSQGDAYIGGGNANKLNWVKKLVFTDTKISNASTADYAKNSAALGGSSLSQILASAGGGKYLPLAGGTMTGTLNFSNGVGITGTMASNDQWRIIGGGSSDSGYLEIATRDNANEPIYVRQYTAFTSTGLKRTATLLDGNGNTSFPGIVTASTFRGNIERGGIGTSWIDSGKGKAALVRKTTSAGYDPIVYAKASTGSWVWATYNQDALYLTYFNSSVLAGTANTFTKQFILNPNGDLSGLRNVTASTFSGYLNGTAKIASSASSATLASSASRLTPMTTLTGGNGNTTGYRLIATIGLSQWSNYRGVFAVKSRHTGAGLLSISVGCNSETVNSANAYAEIKYWGPTGSGSIINSNSWQVYVSSDGRKAYIFWQYSDHNACPIIPLSTDFTVSNGTWMTSISTATYGTRKTGTSINYASDSAALGGSSLSQILAQAGSGNAFTGLDTTTNNVIKLTRANGGTVQKTINNVANATSAANADLLDGIDSSRFIYGSGAHGVNSSYSNASSIWKSGFYDLSTTGGSASGLPTTNAWHWLIEAGHRSNSSTYRYGLQIAAPNDTTNNLYYRINPQSGNGTWRTIIDNHNYANYAADKTAFTGLDTTTNNVIKLTRANGGTVQKTINNVAHATSADRLGGYGVTNSTSGTSATFSNHIPRISAGGVMEVGRYIDFHGTATSRDFDLRFDTGTASKLVITGPSASTVTASYFDGNAKNANQLGGHSSTYFVSKAELGSGSSTGSMNVDAARRIVNSTVNTRNAQSFRVGTPGSGSWTGFPSSYLYSASSTAALKTNAYYRQQVGVLHVAAGTAYHDLVFADAGTDNGIVRVSSKGDTGLILDTTNYATYSTRYNALSSSTLTVTTAGGVNIDGGSY